MILLLLASLSGNFSIFFTTVTFYWHLVDFVKFFHVFIFIFFIVILLLLKCLFVMRHIIIHHLLVVFILIVFIIFASFNLHYLASQSIFINVFLLLVFNIVDSSQPLLVCGTHYY